MTENSYPEELAKWLAKRAAKKNRKDASTVAFLAVRTDVKAAMDAGYAMTTIYEHMRETGRVKTSYETFRLHVRRFIKTKSVRPTPQQPATVNEVKEQKPQKQQEGNSMRKKRGPPKIPEFNFNPTPKKEDLI